MNSFFDNLFGSDSMFREFVTARSQAIEGLSDEDKALLLRQYYAVPFNEYYKRRMIFLAGKVSIAGACCA